MRIDVVGAVVAAACGLVYLSGEMQASAAAEGAAVESSAWNRATVRVDFLGAGSRENLSKFVAPPAAATLFQVAPAAWTSSQQGENRGCSAHNPGGEYPGSGATCSTQAGSTSSCSTNGVKPGNDPAEGTGSACSADGGGTGNNLLTCSSYGASDSTVSHCSGTAGTDQCCSARGSGNGGADAQCSAGSDGDTCSVNSPGRPGKGFGNVCSSYGPQAGAAAGTSECSTFTGGGMCSVFAGATELAHCTSGGGEYGHPGGFCSAKNNLGFCSVFTPDGGFQGPIGDTCAPPPAPTPSPSTTPKPTTEPSPTPKPATPATAPSKTSVLIQTD